MHENPVKPHVRMVSVLPMFHLDDQVLFLVIPSLPMLTVFEYIVETLLVSLLGARYSEGGSHAHCTWEIRSHRR